MKLTITYWHNANHDMFPYFAEGSIEGTKLLACGRSFEDARSRLLEKVTSHLNGTYSAAPPDEEIEI